MKDDVKKRTTSFLSNIASKTLSLSTLMQMLKLYSDLRRGTFYYYPLFKCFFYEYADHYLLMGAGGELFNKELYHQIEHESLILPLTRKNEKDKILYLKARDFCFTNMISFVDDTQYNLYSEEKEMIYQQIEEDPLLYQFYQDGKQEGGELGYMLASKHIYSFLESLDILDEETLFDIHSKFTDNLGFIDYNQDIKNIFFNEDEDLELMYNYFSPYLELNDQGEEILSHHAPDVVVKTKRIYDQLIMIQNRKKVS